MITKRLPSLRGAFEIIGKVKKAFQKPGLLVEPIVRQNRLLCARARSDKRSKRCSTNQQISPSNHDQLS